MSIAQNKKAFFDYFIEDKYEAGIVLEGWEVKAIRAAYAEDRRVVDLAREFGVSQAAISSIVNGKSWVTL